MDERLMIGGVIARDSDATELFVRTHEQRIERAVRDAGVPAADTPDVVQDILIEALRQLTDGRFAYRASLGTWIRHIAKGRVIDYWRAAGRRGLRKDLSFDLADVPEAAFSTPAAQEARLLAEEALASMPARHRLAITAHFRAGVPVEELAYVFGLSVPRTRNIITEAKVMFRNRVCGAGEKSSQLRRLGTHRRK